MSITSDAELMAVVEQYKNLTATDQSIAQLTQQAVSVAQTLMASSLFQTQADDTEKALVAKYLPAPN